MSAVDDIDDAWLHRWPLPMPRADDDKNQRGRVLVVAGSPQVPGAALLAGTAALRAGAGKLLIATGASIAPRIGIEMPESRVVALAEDGEGGLLPGGVEPLHGLVEQIDALLLGPGWLDGRAGREFVHAVLTVFPGKPVILDAKAMSAIESLPPLEQPLLLTPHAGELAELAGEKREDIDADPMSAAARAARRWNCIVALKGPLTVIARPDGSLWRHRGGNVGLASSGSGDVLAGLVVGLAARGAPLEQAAAWAVALHARAGDALATRIGMLGYLARELPGEVPAVMRGLTQGPGQSDLPSIRAT
ncbi:NAD(P)H-hydrate dehydratase [Piscinibacter sp. XHJ-5]|uniref:NAD(P)H-hydrate dehydratase n=1 Tax=Piscinibacter sp. XHJ-5 TaxID=3037797 RepID=UPI00245354AD|nr:NAD(P)H-hydrate dehydratase [Piscinibacter sp. XHJ-5]